MVIYNIFIWASCPGTHFLGHHPKAHRAEGWKHIVRAWESPAKQMSDLPTGAHTDSLPLLNPETNQNILLCCCRVQGWERMRIRNGGLWVAGI